MKKVIKTMLIVGLAALAFGCSSYKSDRKYITEQGYELLSYEPITGYVVADKDGNIALATSPNGFTRKSKTEKNMEFLWLKNIKYVEEN